MAELPEGWTEHMAQPLDEVDLDQLDGASDAEGYEGLRDAIDNVSDQDEMTWLTVNGKRVAAVVTVEEGEEAERRRYELLTAPGPVDAVALIYRAEAAVRADHGFRAPGYEFYRTLADLLNAAASRAKAATRDGNKMTPREQRDFNRVTALASWYLASFVMTREN